jgi:chorismate-pyruvate lyase
MSNIFVETLLVLKDSTTSYLEFLKGIQINVQLESQTECIESGKCLITRVTRLFFRSSENPALYCISYLNKNELTYQEYQFLLEGIIPLGRLFMQLNQSHEFKKTNISVALDTYTEIAPLLNVSSDLIFKKKYDCWVGSRKIGQIVEFFNKESLSRI